MPGKLNNTEKVLEILKAFLPDNCPRGTLELGQELGLDPATVSRILNTLKMYDFVQQNADKKYQLGIIAEQIGQAVHSSSKTQILDSIRPVLLALNEKLKESVHFEILDRDKIKLVIVLGGSKPVKISEFSTWRERSRINTSAGAKAILAFLDKKRLKEIKRVHPTLPKIHPQTISDWDALENQLEEIKKFGFAYENEEHVEGVCAVAIPVFDSGDNVFGAISIPVPLQRSNIIHEQAHLDLLKNAALKITQTISKLQ